MLYRGEEKFTIVLCQDKEGMESFSGFGSPGQRRAGQARDHLLAMGYLEA